jgi:hypothetical protein
VGAPNVYQTWANGVGAIGTAPDKIIVCAPVWFEGRTRYMGGGGGGGGNHCTA